MDLVKLIKDRQIDYDGITSRLFCVKHHILGETPVLSSSDYDLTMIIPCYRRTHFSPLLIDCIEKAIRDCPQFKIRYIFIEHSENREHENAGIVSLMGENGNYMHLPKTEDEPFNKCLAMNTAALVSAERTKYFLFHDLDILFHKHFFIRVFENLQDNLAMSCMYKRRVVFVEEPLTKDIITKRWDIHNVNDAMAGTWIGQEGAPGGSMLIEKNTFFEVGGYDPELFHGYSVEDQFMFDKLMFKLGKVGSADDPKIDLFHLHHSNEHRITPTEAFEARNTFITNMNDGHKLNYLNVKHENIRQFNKCNLPKLRIYDTAFAHGTALGSGDLKIWPDKFRWTRKDDEDFKDIAVVTESCFGMIDQITQKHKIGLIIEPRSLQPELYEQVCAASFYNKFEFIFTHCMKLVQETPHKFRYYPFGGCWIYPHDRKVHRKYKNLSIIASDKTTTQGHKLRHTVIQRHKGAFHGAIFGRGYEKIDYKLTALKDYRFQIVIENDRYDTWFTEKLIDCFTTGTVPVYWGTPKVNTWFNPAGIILWDTLEELDELILHRLNEETYKEMLPAVEDNLKRIREKSPLPDDYIFEEIMDEIRSFHSNL